MGRRVSALLWPLVAVALVIGVWQLLSELEVLDPIIVPAPSEVATAMVDLAQEQLFWEATRETVTETLLGFACGVGGAWILGTLIGTFRPFRLALYPLVIAFQITPRIALAPLFLAWFGLGITGKVVMAATLCFFPVLINVIVGIDTVDADARRLMRSFGATPWEEYRKLVLPSSLPIVFAGIKTAVTLALIGAIVGEFVGGSEGLGVLIKEFNFQLEVAEGFAVILMLSIIGLVMWGVLELLERRLIFWRGR